MPPVSLLTVDVIFDFDLFREFGNGTAVAPRSRGLATVARAAAVDDAGDWSGRGDASAADGGEGGRGS